MSVFIDIIECNSSICFVNCTARLTGIEFKPGGAEHTDKKQKIKQLEARRETESQVESNLELWSRAERKKKKNKEKQRKKKQTINF